MPILRNENPINLEEEKVEAETAPTHNRFTVQNSYTFQKNQKKSFLSFSNHLFFSRAVGSIPQWLCLANSQSRVQIKKPGEPTPWDDQNLCRWTHPPKREKKRKKKIFFFFIFFSSIFIWVWSGGTNDIIMACWMSCVQKKKKKEKRKKWKKKKIVKLVSLTLRI